MKVRVIGYWTTTVIAVLALLTFAAADLVQDKTTMASLAQLGYPAYLSTILGVWKLLAIFALLAPRFPRLKEWAYAGTFFDYSGAIASSLITGSSEYVIHIWVPLICIVITLASWALRPPSRTLGGRSSTKRNQEASAQPAQPPVSVG
jgi:DoxX-like protein